jgi:hypothetical protein
MIGYYFIQDKYRYVFHGIDNKDVELREINSENEHLLKHKKKEITYGNYENAVYKRLLSYIL